MNVKNKLGQITIFVVVAIVIVGIGTAVYFNKDIENSLNQNSFSDVKTNLDSCLNELSKGAVIFVGENAGFYNLPEKYSNNLLPGLAYLMYENENLVPSKEAVEGEIASYIENSFDYCLDEEELTREGIAFTKSENNVKVFINEDNVLINLKTELSLTKNDRTDLISDFSAEVKNVRIPRILEISNGVVNSQIEDISSICMSCIEEIAENNEVYVDVENTNDKDDFIVIITDPSSLIDEESYEFKFAAKYKLNQCEVGECLK